MFSVDNFYSFFDSHYGWKNAKDVIWKFVPDGSKNLNDLAAFVDHDQYTQDRLDYHVADAIIMHDQEPFSPTVLNTYKDWYYDLKKHSMWKEISSSDIFYMMIPTTSWPVFCHSEFQSRDIGFVRDQGFAECHYFWHGLVARDWFRHWKWHADLRRPRQSAQRFLVYSRDHSGSRQYRTQFMQQLSRSRRDVFYDWDQQSTVVDSSYSAKITVDDVYRGAVHIVLETVFDQEKVHLTEKIFKPIVMGQPFFVAAGHGSLEYLKRYGFRTFEHVWDESYDLEPDHQRRMHMIIAEIEKICALSDREFDRILDKCQAVVDYNQQHFFGQVFENSLLNELHANIKTAKSLQTEYDLLHPGGSFFYFADILNQKKISMDLEFSIWIKKLLAHVDSQDPAKAQRIINHYPWLKDF